MGLDPGTKLGTFEITGLLGKGGMGEVYRARDTKLGREVAIKVLPEAFAQDKDRLTRFGREAKLLASLDHPNVGTIHEFQEADGVHFLVMQLVEGETLSERIRKGPLPLREALPIFVQIARGLDAAHESGIVHRDLKPANVKIAPNGDVKVLDFGIAKKTVKAKVDPDAPTTPMTSFPLTDEGTILGTPLYMSPEQARGKEVDSRTDIWAFGCCLYEALTGSTPFPGETMTDIFAAIIEREPDWGALPDSVPREVRRLLRRCLEKNPGERLRDIADARYELEDATIESSESTAVSRDGRKRGLHPALILGTGVLVAAIGIYFGSMLNRDSVGPLSPGMVDESPRITSLAVLPLDNLMNDSEQDYFVDGMTEAITAELSKISSLKVISRTTAMHYKHTELSMPEIAEELGVTGLIEGSVLRDGNEVKITVQLIDGPADAHLWANSYEGTLEDIFQLHSDVALAIAEEIRAVVSPEEHSRIARAPKIDPEAYDLYLRGLETYFDGSVEGSVRAIRYFQRTLDIAPDFALAWARKSFAHITIVQWVPSAFAAQNSLAKEAADKAIALAPDDAAAYYSRFFIELASLDWYSAKATADRAYDLNPNLAEINLAQGQLEVFRGSFSEAERHLERAYALDSHSTFIVPATAMYLAFLGRQARSIQIFELFIAETPNFPLGYLLYSLVLAGTERYDEALEAIDHFERLSRASDLSNVFRAIMLAGSGEVEEARALEREVLSKGRLAATPPELVALYFATVGDFDRAFDYFELGMEIPTLNAPTMLRLIPFAPGWPIGKLAELPEHDRYWELIDRINFPPFPEGHPGHDRQQAWIARKATAEQAIAPIEKIAVLPFVNVSSDPEQEYFVDGMTEALISELAKISALRVISRTSAMRYKDTDKPLPQIARELGVDALIEGSVLKAGNEVRITAQLIDGTTDSHLWAENYVGTLDNILKLQGEVALAIAQAIRITVTPEEETRIATKKPVDPEAYDAYLRGVIFLRKFSPDDLEKAIESFLLAVVLDPGFAQAHALLGLTYWQQSIVGYVRPAPAATRARLALDRALVLDDNLAVAHVTAGWIARVFDWDWGRAERELLRAIEVNPGDPSGHIGLASYYRSVGRFEYAIREVQEAIDLDPLIFRYDNNLADVYATAGRYEEAIALRRKVLELVPATLAALENGSLDYIVLNRYDEAVEYIERAMGIYGRLPNLLSNLIWAYAATGRKVEAEAVLTELHARDRDQYVRATSFAVAYAALGDMDEAFRWIDRALEDRNTTLSYPTWHVWHLLRNDPRFLDMLRRINYPAIAEFEAAMQTANAR